MVTLQFGATVVTSDGLAELHGYFTFGTLTVLAPRLK